MSVDNATSAANDGGNKDSNHSRERVCVRQSTGGREREKEPWEGGGGGGDLEQNRE